VATKARTRFLVAWPILAVAICSTPLRNSARADQAAPANLSTPPPYSTAETPGPAPGAASAEELQQLVAPIALYPDLLLAQILAASTYPTQVVEADRFMKQNPNLTGDALADKINPQPWDPSVKSLCQFPPVLKTMSDSLSWTSALGEAYYNQPQDVLNAVQVMRKRAMDAGTLKTTPQQKVEVQSAPPAQGAAPQQVVVIQPAQTNTVYVPAYNPTTVYGAPVASPPGYSATEVMAAGVLGFGAGVLLGALINDGHNSWGCNWYGGNVVYNRNVWVSNSNLVAGRWGYPGYRPGYPGYRPPGYRPPGYRPVPYTGQRAQVAANNPNLKPNFPKPNTLPNRGQLQGNAGGGGANGAANRPNVNREGTRNGNRGGGKIAANQASGNRPNRPAALPANRDLRGFGSAGRANQGAKNGAFGGYQPGGFTQAASNRGRASLDRGERGFGAGGQRGAGGRRR